MLYWKIYVFVTRILNKTIKLIFISTFVAWKQTYITFHPFQIEVRLSLVISQPLFQDLDRDKNNHCQNWDWRQRLRLNILVSSLRLRLRMRSSIHWICLKLSERRPRLIRLKFLNMSRPRLIETKLIKRCGHRDHVSLRKVVDTETFSKWSFCYVMSSFQAWKPLLPDNRFLTL